MKVQNLAPDIAGALARLKMPRNERAFPIRTQTFSAHRQHEARKRAGGAAKAFIRPENATAATEGLPTEEGDRLHAVIAGDFVFCDFLLAIAADQPGATLAVATLSLSRKNIDRIETALDAGHLRRFELILSHYFQSTSRELYAALERKLSGRADCRVVIARTHCKVALFSWPERVPLVIESSANLRSSGNLEQFSAFADSGLHAFHRGIFDQVHAHAL